MSIAYMNGFDVYQTPGSFVDATTSLKRYGEDAGGTSVIIDGRYGGGALALYGFESYFRTDDLDTTQDMVLGFNLKLRSLSSLHTWLIIKEFNANKDAPNHSIIYGDDFLDDGAPPWPFTFLVDTWYNIQIKYVNNTTFFEKTLFVDGVEMGSLGNTPSITDNYIEFYSNLDNMSTDVTNCPLIDDLYILYEDGITPNTRVSHQTRIESLKPNGAGGLDEWGVNMGNKIAALSGIPIDENLWIQTTNPNDRQDFNFEDLSLITTPLWSQVKTVAKSSTSDTINHLYNGANVTPSFVGDTALSGTKQFLPSNQTLSQINDMKVGYRSA